MPSVETSLATLCPRKAAGSVVAGLLRGAERVGSREKRGTGGGERWDGETAGWTETGRIWRRETGGGDGVGTGGEGARGEGAELGVGVGAWQEREMGWKRTRRRGAWRGLCVVE